MGLIDKLKGVAGRFGRATALAGILATTTFAQNLTLQSATAKQGVWDENGRIEREQPPVRGGHGSAFFDYNQEIQPTILAPVNNQYPANCKGLELTISGQQAPLTYCHVINGKGQVNFITPNAPQLEEHETTLKHNNDTIAEGTTTIANKSPELFSYQFPNENGDLVKNLTVATHPDYVIQGSIPGTRPFTGQTATAVFWANNYTGNKPEPGTITPDTNHTTNELELIINGQTMRPSYTALTQGLAGVFQMNAINFPLPTWTKEKKAQAVEIQIQYNTPEGQQRSLPTSIIARESEDIKPVVGNANPNSTVSVEVPGVGEFKTPTTSSGTFILGIPYSVIQANQVQQAITVKHIQEPTDNLYGDVDMKPIGESPVFATVEKSEPNPYTGETTLQTLRRLATGSCETIAKFENDTIDIYIDSEPLAEANTAMNAVFGPYESHQFNIVNENPLDRERPGIAIIHPEGGGARASRLTLNCSTMYQGEITLSPIVRDNKSFREQAYATSLAHELMHILLSPYHIDEKDRFVFSRTANQDVKAALNDSGKLSPHEEALLRAVAQTPKGKSLYELFDSETVPTRPTKEHASSMSLASSAPVKYLGVVMEGNEYHLNRKRVSHQLPNGGVCTVDFYNINGPGIEKMTPEQFQQFTPALRALGYQRKTQ